MSRTVNELRKPIERAFDVLCTAGINRWIPMRLDVVDRWRGILVVRRIWKSQFVDLTPLRTRLKEFGYIAEIHGMFMKADRVEIILEVKRLR